MWTDAHEVLRISSKVGNAAHMRISVRVIGAKVRHDGFRHDDRVRHDRYSIRPYEQCREEGMLEKSSQSKRHLKLHDPQSQIGKLHLRRW
jgi:hypothetical protein